MDRERFLLRTSSLVLEGTGLEKVEPSTPASE